MIRVDGVKFEYFDQYKGFTDFHKIVGPKETDSRLDKGIIELQKIVNALKDTNKSIKEMHNDLKGMHEDMNRNFMELKQEIREGNNAMIHEER